MRGDEGEAVAETSGSRPSFEEGTRKTLLLRASEAWTTRDGSQL